MPDRAPAVALPTAEAASAAPASHPSTNAALAPAAPSPVPAACAPDSSLLSSDVVSPHRLPKVCVVVPCFNEEEGIRNYLEVLRDVLGPLSSRVAWEWIPVDDGSTDKTLSILNALASEDARIRVYSLARNFGHQIALSAGLDGAVAAGADAVVVMDADLQHPPELLPSMIEHWAMGADIVWATRQLTQDASVAKNWSSRGFYWLFNALSDTQLRVGAADFYLLSRRALQALASIPERRRFLRGLVSWIGFERVHIPYQAPARFAGQSKYTLTKMFRLAFDAVFSFSTTPLQLGTRFGLAVVACGMAYLAYVLVRALWIGGTVLGWPSLMAVVLIMGGMQLVLTGLVGEYVGRVLDESKGRPLYLLKQQPTMAPDVRPSLVAPSPATATPCATPSTQREEAR